MFLESCQSSLTHTDTRRSTMEFKTSWEKMKKKTWTYDLHFGHFQAACNHEHNLLVHYILAEIPFRTGFSPSRWKVATNVMILKKAGLFNIEKLRTLCLFQSDFNHNNKFMGKKLMEHSVDNGLIAKEQYSVTGKKASRMHWTKPYCLISLDTRKQAHALPLVIWNHATTALFTHLQC